MKIYYHKNVELFYQYFIVVVLESGRYISQSKRHYLILKIAIMDLESHFPLITCFDLHLMVGIG